MFLILSLYIFLAFCWDSLRMWPNHEIQLMAAHIIVLILGQTQITTLPQDGCMKCLWFPQDQRLYQSA